MKHWIVLALFLCSLIRLSAYCEEDETPISLAALEGEPSSIVHGCVSVITGDYVEGQADLVIQGVDPLYIQRSYSSHPVSDRTMGNGWTMNHHGWLDIHYTPSEYINFPNGARIKLGDRTEALMTDETGSSMRLSCYSLVKEDHYMYPMTSTLNQGVTNCAKGVISGRTNWKNATLNTIGRRYQGITGDGSKYIYDRKLKDSAQKNIRRLEAIQKPNGNNLSYEYERGYLSRIYLKNKKDEEISSLEITRWDEGKHKRCICVKSHEGNQVEYKFTDKHISGTPRLYVSGTTVPTHAYHYTPEGKTSKICRKEMPEGRYSNIQYYDKGNHRIHRETFEIKSSKDLRMHRVKTILEPTGKDDTPIQTLKLIYNTSDEGKGSKKPLEGQTKVYDAKNHQTIYYYNNEHRLTAIERYTGSHDYKLYSREKIEWGTSSDPTCLTKRTFEDAKGNHIFSRNLEYDARGNIIKEVFKGDIKGLGEVNNYIKTFTYSKDGMNLMLSESDFQATTEYAYYEGTDLIAAQYLISQEIIRKRIFYEYDDNGAVTLRIEDDGKRRKKNNLEGVTHRRFTRTKNTRKGLPELIEENAFDLSTGKEILIHKQENTYDSRGRLRTQKHYGSDNVMAYELTWNYDKYGNVIRQTDPLGQETLYEYDSNGNKTYEQGPNKDHWTTYAYDYSDRLIREEKHTRDGKRYVKHYTYDILNKLASSTDIDGNTTQYRYDEFGRLNTTLYPPFTTEDGKTVQLKASKEHDPMGNVIKQIDACGTETNTAYTIHGNPCIIQHADGTVEKNEYNRLGKLKKATSKTGAYSTYTYDYQSRPLTKSQYDAEGNHLYTLKYDYNAFHLLRETDPNGYVTTYHYDPAGRLIEKSKEERKTTYSYDPLGRLIETQEHNHDSVIIHIKAYDALDRVVEERTEDNQGNIFSKTLIGYDLDGNKTRTITEGQAGLQITQTRYNANKQPIETIDPLGQKVIIQYEPLKRTTIDQAGIQTITYYDPMGHEIRQELKNPYGDTFQKHENKYDAEGRKSARIETVYANGKPEREVVTRWEYDTCGHIIKLTEAAGTAEQKTVKYLYTLGKLEAIVKPDGITIHHRYDSLGRMIEHFATDRTFHYQLRYDNNNNAIEVTDLLDSSKTTRTYNPHSQILEETLGNALQMHYHYDLLGRITSVDHPDHAQVEYEFDPYRLCKVKINNGITPYQHTYKSYDQQGSLNEALLIGIAGELREERDLLNRTISIRAPHREERIESYDPMGNPLSKTVKCAILGSRAQRYTYDELSQVKTEPGHQYEYDSLYNRVFKDGQENTVNPLNQLLSDGKSTFEYDLCGRLIRKTSGEEEIQYQYDAMDRLIAIKQGQTKTTYRYDADHRRISKTRLEINRQGNWSVIETIRYLYQGKNEIGSCDEAGVFYDKRMLGFGQGAEVGAAVAIQCGGRMYAPLHDHNGSVVGLIDAEEGTLEQAYSYTAFGEEEMYDSHGERTVTENPWRYASKRVDEESGLIFFGRRYYDPSIGRWLTPDPMGFEAGSNLYAYVFNNPLSYFDLYGLEAEHRFLDVAGGVLKKFMGVAGTIIKGLAFHFLPVPYLKTAVEGVGHFLGNGTMSNFDTNGHSRIRTVHGEGSLNPKVAIAHNNGMLTSKYEGLETSGLISANLGGIPVIHCYNSSHGLILDLCECIAQKLGIPTHSVNEALKMVRSSIDQVGGVGNGGKVIIFAHSQGGLIMQRVIEKLSKEEKGMLEVCTFGSASIIDDRDLGYVKNYINTTDVVPMTDPYGYMKGLFSKNSDHVEFLKTSTPFDHSINSENYQIALSSECDRIKNKYGH